MKTRAMKTSSRPRSPSHTAKNITPEDRIWEFGCVLGERGGRLLCRACNLGLDHTRRSTIVEHLRSRKHQRLLSKIGLLDFQPASPSPSSATAAPPPQAASFVAPAVIYVDAVDDAFKQDISDNAPSPTSQGLTGPYLLKKEAHCTTVLDQLLRDDTFTDVTLTAEGQSLRAHRIVLCLASSYFRQVLSREQNVQSVVLLRDIKFAELRNIIHFIYTGEATVDATDLESFLRTAEMLEITSLSEGQKYISSRGPSQVGDASGFSIGDFERLVGAKRPNREAQSPPRKSQKVSDENSSSRSPSAEPTAISSVPLVLMEEDPDNEPPSTSQGDRSVNGKSSSDLVTSQESFTSEIDKPGREVAKTRRRRDSAESIGGFAAIAGVHKTSEVEDEVFSQTPKPECQHLADHDKSLNSEANNISLPGRCPYCPHVNQKFEGVAMMRHLLVSHPCKPAFPCSFCWRVFVKRSHFKSHLLNCQQSY